MPNTKARLVRLEKVAELQGQKPAVGSVPLSYWVTQFGLLSDLYREHSLGDVFTAADDDLQLLLAGDKPPGAEPLLQWLIKNEHNTFWDHRKDSLTDELIFEAARDIDAHSRPAQDL